MKKVFCFIYFSLISQFLISQEFSENFVHIVDSLRTELSKSKDETTTLEILRRIALKFTFIDMDSAIYHGQRFINTAEQYNDKVRLLDATGTTDEAYIQKGDLPNALELSLHAIKIYEDNPGLIISTDSTPGIGPANYNLSEIYFHIGDDAKAHEYANKLINMLTDKTGIGYGHYLKGRIFERTNQLDSAMRHILLSLKIFDEVSQTYRIYSDKYDINPDGYNLLAKIYLKQAKPNKALAELKNILGINILNGESFRTAQTYNDLAYFYSTQGIPDSSIYYAEKALKESNKVKFPRGKLEAFTLLAQSYESTDPVKALEYYKRASSIQNGLYGAGNVQVLKDMITQKEKEKETLAFAQSNYQNKLRQYFLSGGLLVFLLIATIFFRNNKKSNAANLVLTKTLSDLKSTQAQLIQSEKMAGLGELTAGIAHEIQNPLNFVNNFSEVNTELIDEIIEERRKKIEERNDKLQNEQLENIKENQIKINHHGKRAESIVKSMLEHSRKSSGIKEPTDINKLCDEFIRLSYHGLRAKDPKFNCEYKLDLDPNLPMVNVISQDIGRVLLNIINNAFQACAERGRMETEVRRKERGSYDILSPISILPYSPLVSLTTKFSASLRPHEAKATGQDCEIIISDNGLGIPDNIKDKIFQPFFTTKPTGQGTGLGLSLAYDIVKAHGGAIQVKSSSSPVGTLATASNEGSGSEFVITLPLKINEK